MLLATLGVVGVEAASAPDAAAYCDNYHNGKRVYKTWGIERSNDNCWSTAYYAGQIRDNGANNGVCAYANPTVDERYF